jgi:hypothetical protein
MDEFGMSEDELYKTGIADMWGNLDAIEGYERQEKMFAHQYENKESKLKKIISESVKKVLKESMYDTNDGFTSSTSYDMQKGNTQQSQVPQFKHVRELDQVSRKRLMDIVDEVLYDDKGYFHGSDTDILAKRLNMTEDEMERNGLMDIIRDTIECELEAGNLY